jgi:hypothetical protein
MVAKTKPRDEKSATAREKVKSDDEAVSRAVTADDRANAPESGSVLPGPPIPPKVQEELRKQKKDD